MTRSKNLIPLALIASITMVAALLVATIAIGRAGDGKETQPVSFNFEGTYRGDQRVEVTGGNNHVREGKFIGKTVRFDLELAVPDVADVNDDGYEDYRDIQPGDKVEIKTELPKGRPGRQPFPVRAVVNEDRRAQRCGQGQFGAC